MFRRVMGQSSATMKEEAYGAFENLGKGLKSVVGKVQEAWEKTPMGSPRKPEGAGVVYKTEEELDKERFSEWNQDLKKIIDSQKR